jgi:hypothetical protein
MNVALRKIANPHIVRALAGEFCDYGSEAAHKLLSDNRALYIVQSAATRDGKRADFPQAPAIGQDAAIPDAPVAGLFSSEQS